MKISIKNYIILILILFTLLPFVALRIIAYPKIQSDLKTVIMDNLEIVGKKQAVQLLTVIETIYTIGGGLFKPLQKVTPIFLKSSLTLSKTSI